MSVQLKGGCFHQMGLPEAPKQPKKADVLMALGERNLEKSGGSSEEEDMDAQV